MHSELSRAMRMRMIHSQYSASAHSGTNGFILISSFCPGVFFKKCFQNNYKQILPVLRIVFGFKPNNLIQSSLVFLMWPAWFASLCLVCVTENDWKKENPIRNKIVIVKERPAESSPSASSCSRFAVLFTLDLQNWDVWVDKNNRQ